MLPPQLSDELCSLRPGVDRLAFSAFFTVDKDGKVTDKQFAKTIVKSVRPVLSTTSASAYIAGRAANCHTQTRRLRSVRRSCPSRCLEAMRKVAELLRAMSGISTYVYPMLE